MNTETLETVEINLDRPPTATVIWLHGLGADGHDFETIVPMLDIPESLPIRYVFPHAPVRPVTINAGMRMRAWYDILDIQVDRRVDTEHLLESADLLTDLVERETTSGMPVDRILLAGFSQGGAIALHVGLRYAEPLANGLNACRQLRGLGYGVLWREYPMMHQVCEAEISDIGRFLTETLNGKNTPKIE
ncbi:phospholipase/carboxylesterase family protein [Olavius algarvensis associated proteobacterium Delta 3]|nr:phospholipase/carboxylesterase family protein [Olavius algarvensis associated proteobacterium Delta 3]